MSEKTELTLNQMYGFKVLGADGMTEFTLSDDAGKEVTITCKHNNVATLCNMLHNLYQEAYAKVKQAPLN